MISYAQPLLIAHRGASGYEPENTLRSFKRAIEMDADGIELDIYVCASGELVVIHDPTVDRTTDGSGFVKQLTYAELRRFDAGQGEYIPLLSEVFDLVNARVLINIELKDPQAVEPLAKLLASYMHEKQWPSEKFLVSSFDHEAVYAFKERCPKISVGLLFEQYLGDCGQIIMSSPTGIEYMIIDYETLTQDMIERIHKQGTKVGAYTVNNKEIAERMIAWQVDMLYTNYPDII